MPPIKTQSLNTLKRGDYFKTVTPEHTLHINAVITVKAPEHISKTVYVYDGYNPFTKEWGYHKFEDINDTSHTKNKNKLVTTDFEF